MGVIASHLCQLPGILAFDWTQQGAHIVVRALTGFAAGKMLADALHEVVKSVCPALDCFGVDIALLWGLHDPSSGSTGRVIILPY
jgi:uncharacterized protein (DUF697 family)